MQEVMRSIAKVYGWPDVTPEAKELIDAPPDILASLTRAGSLKDRR
jgi:hypothetical protein